MKNANFPVHENIHKLIKEGWKKPDKNTFSLKGIKRKYPFDDEDCSSLDLIPRVDVPVAKVAKQTSLPFKDASKIKEPMDRKAEGLGRLHRPC